MLGKADAATVHGMKIVGGGAILYLYIHVQSVIQLAGGTAVSTSWKFIYDELSPQPVVALNGADVVKLHDVIIEPTGRIWKRPHHANPEGPKTAEPANGLTAFTEHFLNGADPCFGHDEPMSPSTKQAAEKLAGRFPESAHDHLISFAGYWQYGVWHFLFEATSAMQYGPTTEASNSTPPTLLLPIPVGTVVHVAERNNWILQWLDLMGISEARGHTIVDGTVSARTAVFPRMGSCGGLNPSHARFLAAKANAHLDEVFGKPAPPCTNILVL